MPREEAVKILKDAETQLGQVVAKAVAAGHYEDVIWLTKLMQWLAEMTSDRLPPHRGEVSLLQRNTAEKIAPRRAKTTANSAAKPASKRTGTVTARPAGKQKNSDYPQFKTERDELIKIGWSRRDQQEYQHRAPKSVVDALADQIIARCKPGELFVTDDIFPLGNGPDVEIPSYQAYLSLAWLREESLIEQDGRRGYRLPPGVNLRDAVDECWSRLGDHK